MTIDFVTTGGTIDKDYATTAGTYDLHIAGPVIERILEPIRPNFDCNIHPILKLDSLDITDKEREAIFEFCNNLDSENIIITHGTDTMTKTAKVLSKIEGKTIVLTGASRPEIFKNSDAAFNLGFAISAVQNLEPGIYIAMNGVIHQWNQVYKANNGIFTEIQ